MFLIFHGASCKLWKPFSVRQKVRQIGIDLKKTKKLQLLNYALNYNDLFKLYDYSLIYNETGIHMFNCRLSNMKQNRPLPSIMYPIMTGQDKNQLKKQQ